MVDMKIDPRKIGVRMSSKSQVFRLSLKHSMVCDGEFHLHVGCQ